ncbi:hypothetical protein [Flavobacterium oreochromis]|uniref:hypothetical protein n=1 Tax=Flavobacterium oreochromis TaxID=2906078 RepID=UPI00385F7BB2
MKKLIVLFFIGIVLSCEKKEQTAVSFYYWKTRFHLSEPEKQVLTNNEVQQLYLRYFDVALVNGVPMPIAPIHFSQKKVTQKIIPVVFIKNEVFLDKHLQVADLAYKILKLVHQINKVNALKVAEIQIDCDWSLASKEAYMQFLALLKKQAKEKISVTIRLHQIKYFKETKVPPVDSGVLMFYNMGQLSAKGTNSIYDAEIAKKYLYHLKDYPLRLSVALPIFSWWVHTRGNRIINLISKMGIADFENNPNFEVHENTIRVKRNSLYKGFYFQENDGLRLEAISKADLEEMKDLLQDRLPQQSKSIIFYDLDQTNFKYISDESFFKTFVSDF